MNKNSKIQIELGIEKINPELNDYLQTIIENHGIIKFLEMARSLFAPETLNIKIKSEVMSDYISSIIKTSGTENFIKFIDSINYPYKVSVYYNNSSNSAIISSEGNNPKFFTPNLPSIPIPSSTILDEEKDIEEKAIKIENIYKERKSQGKIVKLIHISKYLTSAKVVGKLCERNHIIVRHDIKEAFRCIYEIIPKYGWGKEIDKYLNGLEKYGTKSSWEYTLKFDIDNNIPGLKYEINSFMCPLTKSSYDIASQEIKVIIEILGPTHYFNVYKSGNKFERKPEIDRIKHDYAISQGYTILYYTKDKRLLKNYNFPYPVYTDREQLISKLIEIYNKKNGIK